MFSVIGEMDSWETPRCILLGISIIGILLAYITDESHLLFVGDESLKASLNLCNDKSTAEKRSSFARSIVPGVSIYIRDSVLETLGILFEYFGQKYKDLLTKFEAYNSNRILKKLSKTKRQLFYMIEKQILKVPIIPGETEVESYLDVKNHMLEKKLWPFMWEVDAVKELAVKCNGFDCIPMSSYSYLDLMRDERVQDAAIDAARKWSSGNHGPRMLGGNMKILRDLEGKVASFFGREDSLICATGYLACMSACAAVATEETVIFADNRLHASLRAGLKLGDAQVFWFRHNNFVDCEQKVLKNRFKKRNAWMILESVYSMDGDICDLPQANEICKRFDIKLMIDEAHGLGVVGKTGRGVEELFNLQGCATLIVGTFSKSIASIGGYIAGDRQFISYLDFHATGNVFSAPLPAYSAGAAIKSFELIEAEPQLVNKAQQNSIKLRQLLITGGGRWPKAYPENFKYEVGGDVRCTVIPLILRDDLDRVMRIASHMKQLGFMCSAVAYPACPLQTPRFRITATSSYTDDQMEKFVHAFIDTCVAEGPSNVEAQVS